MIIYIILFILFIYFFIPIGSCFGGEPWTLFDETKVLFDDIKLYFKGEKR